MADRTTTAEMMLFELANELVLWNTFAPVIYKNLTIIGVCCCQVGCDEVARWRCYWPGNTCANCTVHRDRMICIARTLGFDLVTSEIDVREPDASKARFAAMELY